MVDLLIQNGYVMDPAQGISEKRNVVADKGRILECGDSRPEARVVLDASGCIVTPGLIDFHTHFYYGKTGLGCDGGAMPYTGVTAAVDAGSSGCENFEDFYRTQLSVLPIRAKAFLSCYSKGMAVPGNHEDFSPSLFEPEKIGRLLRAYPDTILGFKIRIGRELMKDLRPLKAALALSDSLGELPLCVHITNAPESLAAVADMMRRGDIICHVYHGTGNTVLDDRGRVLDEIREARDRGVLFDASNGNMNNSHAVTLACLEQGFFPDIISTDMTGDKFCKGRRAKSLPFIMSKYLSMGMPVLEIIRCVTQTPAAAMNEAGRLGTLAAGSCADISILRICERKTVFEDTTGQLYTGSMVFEPVYGIVGGKLYTCRPDCC